MWDSLFQPNSIYLPNPAEKILQNPYYQAIILQNPSKNISGFSHSMHFFRILAETFSFIALIFNIGHCSVSFFQPDSGKICSLAEITFPAPISYLLHTFSPRKYVASTCRRSISSSGRLLIFPESITKSADLPFAREPVMFSMKH